uniref:Reverse transcriptase domain-containing protein n=1 Tax=Oreochromis niloticus TaxID=8128 RepID=A0A669DYS2_ORENI
MLSLSLQRVPVLWKTACLVPPASTVRVMFFDFSSAFNTIRPTVLGDKLTAMQVDAPFLLSPFLL